MNSPSLSAVQRPPVIVASEGRWPRICARHDRPGDRRIAMLSMHTSPLAALGRSRDAGGMNVYVRELARHLGRRAIAVDVFTRWTDPAVPQILPLGSHARLIHIPAGPLGPVSKHDLFPLIPAFVAGVECFAVSQRLDYDLIHSHYWLSGAAGMDLARRWGAPHLAMFHTLARLKQHARPEERESDLRIEQERLIIAGADGVIVATEDEREQITRLYGLSRQAMHTVPCGVDLAQFAPGDRAAARARLASRLRLGDEPLLLYVGRLDPLKGPELLIRALPLLRERATLALVGGDGRDPERARLRDLAVDLGVAERVRLVDAAPQEQLPDYYRAADLALVASHYESFGLVAVEALACGTPVVAPSVGGLPAIVRDGVNGALLAQRTPAAFAAAIGALLRAPERRARLAAAARASIRHLSWPAVAGEIEAIYDATLAPELIAVGN